MTLAPRYASALAAMELTPGCSVLELGPGHGVAVAAVLDRVAPDGRVHLVDRSAAMIAAARRRNADAIEDGRVTTSTARVQDADLPTGAFDRVLAVRVRELWTDAPEVLPRVHRWLARDGRLVVVLDAPGQGRTQPVTAQLAGLLPAYGFDRVEVAATAAATTVTARRRPHLGQANRAR